MTQDELPPWAFGWEKDPPLHAATGFLLVGGNVTVNLGYMLYPQGVLLLAFTKIGGQEPTLWRRHWAPKETAVDAAESLAGDAEEYIFGTLGLAPRPIEDLDLDDFIQHLHMRLNNELH